MFVLLFNIQDSASAAPSTAGNAAQRHLPLTASPPNHLRGTDSSASMALTVRNNNNGVQVENGTGDQFWLLKSYAKWQRTILNADGKEEVIQPITLCECDLRLYQSTPRLHNNFIKWGRYDLDHAEKVHGRRVNDEVELFGMDADGNETPGLREELEKRGLTVRSWAEESTKSKFPSRRLVFGKEKSFIDRCQKTMHEAVVQYEIDTDEAVPYALLADPGNKHSRHLLAVIVDAKVFECAPEMETITTNGCQYKIVGFYHDKKTWFTGDDVAKHFFTKDGGHVEVCFYNHTKHLAQLAAEAARQEKKAAKKHRRQQTAASSITTSSCGNAFGQSEDGSEAAEARAEAKREKEKAKKKAYHARRKAKQAESEQALILSREVDRKTQEEEDSAMNNNIVSNSLGIFHILSLTKASSILQRTDRHDSRGEVVSEASDSDKDELLLGTEDSSSNEDAGESQQGLTVIKVDDAESGRRAVAEAQAKGPVMVMSQEDVDLEAGEYNTGGFQYYTRT